MASTRIATDLAKSYDPRAEEPIVRARWEAIGPFHADPAAPGEPYCIVIPPPNVTAPLHLGHALNNSLQDILVRYHRARGFNTLWMPGTDHAGIATQTVVDKRLQSEGKPAIREYKEMERAGKNGREQFVAKVQAWKDEYEADIIEQLKLMGCSCDWQRLRFTMDEVCAAAVREAFFILFKAGLIYRGKRLVNWDPATQTALADDEVENEEIDGHFWYLKYPIVDEHGSETGQYVTVATTRPETMLGDTAIAVNPRDEKRAHLVGQRVRLPIVNRVIPIIADDYVVLPDPDSDDAKAKYASGFLKVTPAHDPNDWEIGRRHDLPVVNVMAPDGTISNKHGWEDAGEGAEFVLGLDRYEAREAIVTWFRENDLLADVKPYRHSVGHSYRSHVAIEPYLSDQWYVKVTDDKLRGAALRAMAPDQRAAASASYSGTGVSPVRTKGTDISPAARTPRPPESEITDKLSKRRRNLPHWERGGRTYFITFRLNSAELTADERNIVGDACLHWHEKHMLVHLITVMPDHVHLLITPLRKDDHDEDHWHSLAELMQSIKGFTAHEINARRGTSGTIWQDEYFDRIVGDEAEFEEKWNYMWMNPVKAGLVARADEYPFTLDPNKRSDEWCGREDRTSGGGEADEEVRTGGTPVPLGGEVRTGETPVPLPVPLGGEELWHGRLRFHPARYARTFQSWHENLRDWCISRQLWWGHRIPVWGGRGLSGETTEGGRAKTLAELEKINQWTEEDRIWVHLADTEEIYDKQVPEEMWGEHYFICVRDPEDREVVEQLEKWGLVRDPDVLDTWFSSALWPMSTMGWPDPGAFPDIFPEGDALLETYNPSNVLCTARDIITLWLSRMVMFNTFFRNRLPFTDVFIHPMIQDGEGRRMSKSLGNGVDPRDIIRTKGTDALRFVLAQMTTQTQDVRMPVEFDEQIGANTSPKFEVGRRLCNKLWNATRFALATLGEADGGGGTGEERPTRLVDRWMLSRLATVCGEIERAIAEYDFNVYAQAFYDLFWRDFCDWYLEAVKPTIREDPLQQSILRAVLGAIHRIAHPLLPFITERLHESIEHLTVQPLSSIKLPASELAAAAAWPTIDQTLIDPEAEAQFARVRELVSAIREVRSMQKVPDRRQIVLHAGDDETVDLIERARGTVQALAGLKTILREPAGEADRVTFRCAGVEHALGELIEGVDLDVERDRLTKKRGELDQRIAGLTGRLANEGYVDKAPAHLVEETRKQLAEVQVERDDVIESLKKLSGTSGS